MRMLPVAVLILLSPMAADRALADWPQFMGPARNGVATATGLARAWPKAGPKEVWSVAIGDGFAGTAIDGGRVYFLDRVDSRRDAVRCLSLADGKEVWRCAYEGPNMRRRGGPRCTPAVGEKFVFTISVFGRLQCVRKADGKAVWDKDLVGDFGGMWPVWGVSQSPVLHKNVVIVAPQGGEAGVVAFEKATGKVVWKTPPISAKARAVLAGSGIGEMGFEMSYTSPLIATIGGVEQLVVVSNDRVVGVGPGKGQVLWTFKPWRSKRNIPAATPVGDGRLFLTSGYGIGAAMIQATRGPDGKWGARELFRTKEVGAQCQQPLLHKGHLYIGSNSNSRRDGLACLTLDGTVKWKTKRTPNFGRGPLILADGWIYALDGAKGILHLVDPSPAGYKELARARIFRTKMVWATMSMSAEGKLLLHDSKELKCLDVKNP